MTVVGAGFAGLLTTVHLLRTPGVHVVLVDRAPVFGLGAAYATENPDHRLNVRAGNMSAFPDQPTHLRSWLEAEGRPAGPDDFISRATYGDYLRSLLAGLVADPSAGPRLRLLRGEATDLRRDGDWRLAVAGEAEVVSDAVVLALGNLEPMTPAILGEVAASPLYVGDPWRDLARIPDTATRILLLGAGLTMVDVALALHRPDRELIALSRRGLLPHAHAAHPPVDPAPFHGGPCEVLRQVRAAARTAPWRGVVDQLRPQVRAVWRTWSTRQRGTALRHLKPYWDVHRHRLAPTIAARVARMRDAGQLSIHPGRVTRVAPAGRGVRVDWRARGSHAIASLEVDAIVNCTGPEGDVTRSDRPLLRSLLARGLVTGDPTGLGAQVDDRNRPLDAGGQPVAGLYAVGSLTRGAFWEITAVPEIRVQVAEVAAAIGRATTAV